MGGTHKHTKLTNHYSPEGWGVLSLGVARLFAAMYCYSEEGGRLHTHTHTLPLKRRYAQLYKNSPTILEFLLIGVNIIVGS
jgi:hypothetical protein